MALSYRLSVLARVLPVLPVLVVACQVPNERFISPSSDPPIGPPIDTGIDAGAVDGKPIDEPATITISGTVVNEGPSGASPLEGAVIEAYRAGDDTTPVGTATSDAQGSYLMTVLMTATPVVYIKVSKPSFVDTYHFPPAPISASATGESTSVLTTSLYNLLANTVGQVAGKSLVAIGVVDAAGAPVSGATVLSIPPPTAYKYSNGSGLPADGTATAADGLGFLVNAMGDDITVGAAKPGVAFKSHVITAHPDRLTTTLVTQ